MDSETLDPQETTKEFPEIDLFESVHKGSYMSTAEKLTTYVESVFKNLGEADRKQLSAAFQRVLSRKGLMINPSGTQVTAYKAAAKLGTGMEPLNDAVQTLCQNQHAATDIPEDTSRYDHLAGAHYAVAYAQTENKPYLVDHVDVFHLLQIVELLPEEEKRKVTIKLHPQICRIYHQSSSAQEKQYAIQLMNLIDKSGARDLKVDAMVQEMNEQWHSGKWEVALRTATTLTGFTDQKSRDKWGPAVHVLPSYMPSIQRRHQEWKDRIKNVIQNELDPIADASDILRIETEMAKEDQRLIYFEKDLKKLQEQLKS